MDERTCRVCGEVIRPAHRYGPHLSVHTRQANAKYIYKPGDKHPYERKACVKCGRVVVMRRDKRHCSTRCVQTGDTNSAWRGDEAGYASLHARVYRKRGQPSECKRCGTTDPAKRYEWANLTGDYADIHDYERMCVPCHRAFDACRRRAAKASA